MGPVMQDLTTGRIDFGCDFVSGALAQIKGNSVKGLAVLTKERSAALPVLATADEQGLKDFQAYNWNALFLAKGTPEPIVRKLNEVVSKALDTPAVRDRFTAFGAVIPAPERRTPEYLAQFVKDEIKKWEGPIKESGATLD